MTDLTELKRLADAAPMDMTMTNGSEEHKALIAFTDEVKRLFGNDVGMARVLIDEIERLKTDCLSMRASLKAGAASTKKLVKDGSRAARERDQFKAENQALREENERLRQGRPVYKTAFYKFPEKLLRLRLEKGLSQRDLSAMTGMSCPLISMYETGRTRPGMKNILRLEKALDCPGAFQGASHD